MRTLAIGDIHGCSLALDRLLDAVAPAHNDLIITLGDYVNRGPDSRGVLERLIKLHADGRLIAIKGNHEQMMIEARHNRMSLADFLSGGVGGAHTLLSYEECATLADIPDAHWDFIEKICRDYYENDTHFFVHASAYPDYALAEQPPAVLRWERFNNPPAHESGKIMICGHTSQKSGNPINLGHAICIDTCAYGKGWLTCLDTTSGRMWQTNQNGDLRTGWIIDYLVDE